MGGDAWVCGTQLGPPRRSRASTARPPPAPASPSPPPPPTPGPARAPRWPGCTTGGTARWATCPRYRRAPSTAPQTPALRCPASSSTCPTSRAAASPRPCPTSTRCAAGVGGGGWGRSKACRAKGCPAGPAGRPSPARPRCFRSNPKPHPHAPIQNLGEAEYLVSVYQYMRLLGYPAHKISVLTTYNGQKALLRDVFERRLRAPPRVWPPRQGAAAGDVCAAAAVALPPAAHSLLHAWPSPVMCACIHPTPSHPTPPHPTPPHLTHPAGHHRGQVPGPAERLHPAVPGAHAPLWPPARRAAPG